jgi:RNA polymerase sigma-70 factor (ECF subfamily)
MLEHAPADVAVAELMDRHGGRLYSLGLRFCGNDDEAQDLVQDTFLLAFRKWDQFEGRSDPATWLYRIAARVCQRRHRKRSGEPRQLEPLEKLLPSGDRAVVDVAATGDGPAELLAKRERRAALEAAIASLPGKFRLPLVLKEIVELSVSDVARILGIKEATVKTRLHRARLQLAKELRRHLPMKAAPPPDHSRRMCLDLLKAKQESLDRGVDFPVANDELCERCRSLFATLDLGRDACRHLSDGELPEELRELILREMRASS